MAPERTVNKATSATGTARQDHLLVEAVGDDLLILDRHAGRIHCLNATAGIVWRGLQRALSRNEIVETLTARYDVNVDRAQADTDTILTRFGQLGLVAYAEAADVSNEQVKAT